MLWVWLHLERNCYQKENGRHLYVRLMAALATVGLASPAPTGQQLLKDMCC